MTLKFKKPPINELIISTYFNPPIHGLRNEHIGLFWHSIKDEFPVVSQQPPIPNTNLTIEEEIFPMPRYWMISLDDTNVIQIQKHAFMLNWRHRDTEYPYYENIKPIFDKYYSKFQDFLVTEIQKTETNRPQIDVCELTYINTIESCDYWSGPGDVDKVIPSFSIPTIKPPPKAEPGYNCSFAYIIDDDLQLRVSVRNAQAAQHPETPVLVLEIRASGRIDPTNKSTADSWFDRGHQAISSCFLSLTNPDIQRKYWMRENNSK